MSARRSKQSLCPPDRVLNVDVVAKHFGCLDVLTEGVTPRRLSGSDLDQRVDRVAGDSESRAGSFREGLNKGLANGCQPLKLYQPMTVLE